MEQWEYKTIKYKTGGFLGGKVDPLEFEEILNQYGYDGWELVSSFDTSMGEGTTRNVIAIFKRRKQYR